MPVLEERDVGPDVDGLVVVSAEVVIEAREQQLLDPGLTLGLGERTGRPWILR